MNLSVQIAELADHRTVDISYDNQFETQTKIDYSLENTGSVGCEYRSRAIYSTDEGKAEAWSRPKKLWPGETAQISIHKIFENTNDKINGTLYLEYCDNQIELQNFNFTVNSSQITNNTVRNVAIRIENSSANVLLGTNADMLVPVESPGLWKVSHSPVKENKAKVTYDPPIFQERKLRFYVVDSGSIVGVTEVDLTKSSGLSERLNKIWQRIQLNL